MLRILGIVILAIAAGGGYYGYTNYYRATTVTTSVAMSAPVSEAIYGTGTVEPARWAKVLPLQRRRLVDLCTCEGQSVKAGQVLGRQDDAEERNALTQLQISSQQAQRDLDRAEKDRTKSDAAQKEYEQRWTQAEEYKSRIAAQQVRIDQLVLRAPLDGMVLRRDGEVGEIVGPTDVLFWVGPPLPMQVVAEVNEEEINRIAVSQKAFLRSEAFPGQALRASVSQITPKGDPTRKTFRVYLLLPERHAAPDRHVGRGQYHLPRKAFGHRRSRRGGRRRLRADREQWSRRTSSGQGRHSRQPQCGGYR